MSYDIRLVDPVTKEPLLLEQPHFITGGTYAIGGTKELWLNITYNYGRYYYEATEGDPDFAHDEVTAHYADGTTGPIETEYGIRGIYGKSGAQSIPLLERMIERIKAKYQDNKGEWITTKRDSIKVIDTVSGREVPPTARLDAYHHAVNAGKTDAEAGKMVSERFTTEEVVIDVYEGPNQDYWVATAANAMKPLYQLIAFAQMRPDGLWEGD